MMLITNFIQIKIKNNKISSLEILKEAGRVHNLKDEIA